MIIEDVSINRNIRVDGLRCIAIVNVIAVHYLAYTGYYDRPLDNWGGWINSCARVIFITCVPLFLLITGYLSCSKNNFKLSRVYYYGLTRVVLSYFIAGTICQFLIGIIDGFYFNKIIISLITFKAAPYGWYIG